MLQLSNNLLNFVYFVSEKAVEARLVEMKSVSIFEEVTRSHKAISFDICNSKIIYIVVKLKSTPLNRRFSPKLNPSCPSLFF